MKCPGQDMQYWNAEAIFEVDCPKCQKPVEFYKDDTNRRCNHCGHRFVNPKMDFGCAAYCPYAEQCLGTLPEEFVGAQDGLLKDKVAVEMKRYFKSDFHRIGHTTRVARYAEAIGKTEGGNLAALLCAAYLHDVGHPGDSSLDRQQTVAAGKEILSRLNAKQAMLEAVTLLLLGQTGENGELAGELSILKDARNLAQLEESYKQEGTRQQQELSAILHTDTARKLAAELASQYA
ncbi:MAG: HD domain-containing protein [Desulfopila sp.]